MSSSPNDRLPSLRGEADTEKSGSFRRERWGLGALFRERSSVQASFSPQDFIAKQQRKTRFVSGLVVIDLLLIAIFVALLITRS